MPDHGPTAARRMLVIPDAHAHPGYDNARFDWLGRLIAAERPDVVVCLGDFADMPALSQYDKGKRGFEGRRYTRDVDATRDALRRLHSHVHHGPEWIMCLGNHEARIDRARNDNAEFDGTISVDDLGYREHGWQVVPYQSTALVAGFAISHHFASGVAGRPIGGMNQAAAMTRLLYTSAIVGHSHVVDYARRTRPDGSHVLAIVAGCYAHPEQIEGWNEATAHLWWHGVVVLEDAAAGDCGELRWITMERIRALYGNDPRTSRTDPPTPQPIDLGGLDLDDDETTATPIRDDEESYRAVAKRLGVGESSVRRWCQRNRMPASAYEEARRGM